MAAETNIQTHAPAWHSLRLPDLIRRLNTNPKSGLSDEEAKARTAAWGRNVLPEVKKTGPVRLLLRQFQSPLVYILLIAAVITWLLGEYVDMTVILLVVAVNALIGFFQEYRANKIFEKLKAIITVEAIVIRDGKLHLIQAADLVPGDVIVLKGGYKVPADARLVENENLQTGEALLTGESMPVSKGLTAIKADAAIGDRRNMVFMGTVIEQGEGRAVVVATGSRTEIGKISLLTQRAKEEDSPLQLRVKNLGRFITQVVVSAAVAIFLVGLLLDRTVTEMLTTSIAIAVASIPEGLPAAISVILAVSSKRILERQGLVRKLVAAETLGSTSVICADKTGTLTYGQMRVEKIITPPLPPLSKGGIKGGYKQAAYLAMALANEAVVEEKDGKMIVRGEATDKAKLESFLAADGNLNETLSRLPRFALLPFDPKRKYIASFHHDPEGKGRLFISGAPETVLKLSRLSQREKDKQKQLVDEYAGGGFRLIALAEKKLPRLPAGKKVWKENELLKWVSELDWLGLSAIRDPIRKDVRETIRETREAGIKVVMITGDHLLTARAIGEELGFSDRPGAILTGEELDNTTDAQLKQVIHQIEIIARATPEHKMRVIDAWQSLGAVVAMTGDGVNDAPALKAADIGVAVGSGTDVSKEASDLVLLNDSFSTITAAVREGRIGFANIRKVTILLMSNAFTELILILSSLVLLLPFPITAVQILWANLVEDALPVLALAFEPGEKGMMRQRPLKKSEPILDREAKILIFAIGLLTDLILVGVFLYLLNVLGWEIERIRSFIFAAVGTDTLFYIFAFKSLKQPFWRSGMLNNKFLLVATAIGFAALFAAIYLPVLNRFLETVPLALNSIILVFALGGIKVLLVEIVKWWYREND